MGTPPRLEYKMRIADYLRYFNEGHPIRRLTIAPPAVYSTDGNR